MQCLNIKKPEVAALLEEYTKALGSEEAAYYVLSENDGLPLDRVPVRDSSTGESNSSKLFNDLLEYYKGDKQKAIVTKSQIYTDSFKQEFGDWNLFTGVSEDVLRQVELVFKRNPKLQEIGTLREYAAYIQTIYPNSVDKSVYWHGSDSDFSEGFDKAIRGEGSGAAHTKTRNDFYLAKPAWSVLQYVSGINRTSVDKNGFAHWNKLWWELKEIMSNGRRETNAWKDLVIDEKNVRQAIPNKAGIFNRDTNGTNGKWLRERKADYGYENKTDKEFFEEVFGIEWGVDTFNTWTEKNANIFKSLETSEKGIYPAIINVKNPITEEGQNTYYEEQRKLFSKASKEGNDSILGSKTDNEFGSDVAVVFDKNNVYFLGTTKDLEGFKNFVIANRLPEKLDENGEPTIDQLIEIESYAADSPDVYPFGDQYHFTLAKDYRNGKNKLYLKNRTIAAKDGKFFVKNEEEGTEVIDRLKHLLGEYASPYLSHFEMYGKNQLYVYLRSPKLQTIDDYLNAPVVDNNYVIKLDNDDPYSLSHFILTAYSNEPKMQKILTALKSIRSRLDVQIEYTDTPLNQLFPQNKNITANTPAAYIVENGTPKIVVYKHGDTSLYGGFANVLLHETLHHLTVSLMNSEKDVKDAIESLYLSYKKEFGYSGSIEEFVADLYSRPEVINNVVSSTGVISKTNRQHIGARLVEKLKYLINLISKVIGKEINSDKKDLSVVSAALFDKIIDYAARIEMNQMEYGTGENVVFGAATAREELAAKDIAKNFDDIIKTVELRIKSLQYSNVDLVFDKKEINRAEKLNATLYNIRNTIKDGEVVDNLIAYTQGINHYIDTIQDSLSEAEYVLNQISNRLANPVIVSNPEKLQSLRTALDTFYSDYLSPHRNNVRQLLKSLQTQYNSNIYKNAIGEDVYNQLTAVLDYLNRQLSSSKMSTEDNLGWIYANTVKATVTDFLQKEMEEANDPTVEHALENWLTFEGDVSSFNRRFATVTSSNHTVVRIIRKVIGDVYNSTRRQVYDKFAQIKGVIYKVNNPKDIFETDENGKRTGYIVRDRRYGVYQKDKYEWRQNWLERNGLASFEELRLNPESFVKYQKDYNKFKADHAERRFTPEFYDIFANLSYETNMALSEVNKDIELILAPYIGKDGKPRFEEMSEEDYSRWEMAQSRKRNLANPYDYITGELKPAGSVEAKIAQELQSAYAKLQNGLKSKVNMEAFLREMDEMSKVKGYTPDGKYTLYEAWLDRNTRWETTEEFNEIASKQIKQDYGETYNKLYEARKNLLNLYRNSKYEVMYKSMPQEVKNKIKLLDVAMYKIRSKAPRLGLHHALYNTELSSEVERNGGIATLTSDDYFLDNKGRKIYYSYLNRVVPKNKKFFKRVPNKNWAETSVESAYHNNNYDAASQEAEQPKLSIKRYDNRKTYNKLMRDANFVAFRNTIINTIAEANEKLTYSVYKNSYKFPQVLGHIGNYIARKGLFTGIKEYTFDAFSITPDDELHGINNNTRPDGTELNIIPTMYTTMLNDPNLLTNDVVGAIMKYYRMACNYENKRKVAPQLNLLDTLVKSEGQIEKNGVIESAESSELEKQIHEYIGYHLYGRRQTLPEYNIKGNRVSLDKVFKAFATWGRDSGLAWNIRSAISGGLSAISFYFSDATINKHYNKRNFNQAVGIVTKDMLTFKQLAQLGKNMSSCKTLALLEYNGLSFNQEEDLSHANRWRVGRIVKRMIDPYAAFQMASFLPNSVLVNSVYLNYKLIKLEDGTKRFISEYDFYSNFPNLSEDVKKQIYEHSEQTLLDAYEIVDGALKPKEAFKKYITEDLENEVSNIMLHLSSHAEGMVEEADKSGIYFNTALSTILMFRAFLPKNIENTVGNFKPYWNYQTKELTFPTLAALAFGFKYGSSYKLVNLIYNLKTNQSKLKNQEELEALKEKYKGTDVNKQIDKYIGRFNAQIMTYLFWCAIFYAVAAYTDGDDDNYFSSALKLELNKVALESGSRYNVMDVPSIFNSITPLTGTIEDVYKVIYLPDYFNGKKFRTIKRGAYKGYSVWFRDLMQLIPPAKAYFNLRNPDEKLRDLQNRIK